MPLAIGIIHGMGPQKPGFSRNFQRKLQYYYQQRYPTAPADDLIFAEIYWADILKSQERFLYQQANYQHDFAYNYLRHFFVDYLGDAVGYQPLNPYQAEQAIASYDVIHERVRDCLEALAGYPSIDPNTTPLILMGHSLGTVILSNYIWDHQKKSKKQALFQDTATLAGLFTFGSPIALWSLRFKSFDHPIQFPSQTLPAVFHPHARWYNFYSQHDIIAYPLKHLNQAYDRVVHADIALRLGNLLTRWTPLTHLAYWEDIEMIRIIAGCLADLSQVMLASPLGKHVNSSVMLA